MTSNRRPLLLLALLALVAWIFWLRWPSFERAFWNLDEGIYATVGKTVIEGGVMYRDAIDHRAPVTHYATGLIFLFAGTNNAWAMHFVLAGMISSIALALFLLGRRWRDSATGLWAAAILAAFSTDLFYIGDAYSVSCEWFIALFSTWSAWWFWACWSRARFWPPFLSGVGYALAFMSKQPGLLEIGAPVALLVYLAATQRLTWLQSARVLGGLVTGFTVMLALIFAYFWWRGVLTEFYFYGWTYNLIYYGADTSLADRMQAAAALPGQLAAEYPLQLAAIALGALACLRLATRHLPNERDTAAQPASVFLLFWLLLSAAGSAAAGRVHAHYYIQSLPALCLAGGWLLGSLTARSVRPHPAWLRVTATALLLVAGWNLVAHPLRGRARPTGGLDTSYLPAGFVKAHSMPEDRVIVWGLYPDFYVFADRRPASRYIYTSFQTGVQPGKNTAANINTDYGAVPGAVDALVRDLDASRPIFFVDSSLGPQRLFEKYPLIRYPALHRFVHEHYVEVETQRFHPHGFAVWMLKDSSRREPLALAGGTAKGVLPEPSLLGMVVVPPTRQEYSVTGTHPGGQLQRLELLVNDTVASAVSFPPSEGINVKLPVDFARLGPGRYRLAARATSATGETRTSPVVEIECAPETLTPAQHTALALRVAAKGPPLLRVRAPFGVDAGYDHSNLVFFAHAPSMLTYELPANVTHLTGSIAIRPGAYAADNPSPTDGAEFTVTVVTATGQRAEIFRRLLRPREVAGDRGDQSFDCTLPAWTKGSTIEFAIGNGPANSASSDWTYWSNLLLIAR